MEIRRKQKKSSEKMPATYGAFHQHIKRAHLQSLIFNQADKAVIEMKNLEHFGWKFHRTYYIAIATDNPIAPDTVISFASCKCKGNVFLLAVWLWGSYLTAQIIIFFDKYSEYFCVSTALFVQFFKAWSKLSFIRTNSSLKLDKVLRTS